MLRKLDPSSLARAATTAATTAALLLALAACGPAAPGPPAGDAARGRDLIEQYQCGRCHAVPGVAAARGSLAVTLEGFGARSYIAGRIANRPDTLVAWLVDPPALVPGTLMPNLGVDAAQARDMAAYLATLR